MTISLESAGITAIVPVTGGSAIRSQRVRWIVGPGRTLAPTPKSHAVGEETEPLLNDLQRRPLGRGRGVGVDHDVKVVVHDAEAADVDGEEAGELNEAVMEPLLAVLVAVTAQKGALIVVHRSLYSATTKK